MKFLPTLLASALQVSSAFAASTQDWKSRNIYFALTDRVARSATDAGGAACSNLNTYCGGTFKGLEGKLDYIKGMGFDAIWITPVVQNTPDGYHGYWASDLYKVNDKYGTADDLKSLVNTAHSKGIYMMVDVVANHMGRGDYSKFSPAPLNQASAYHTPCNINYADQGSIEYCMVADILHDINTEDAAMQQLLQDWVKWLVAEFKFDGVRIDTVKHVPKSFWPEFAWDSGVYTIGEVFDGNPDYLAGYDKLMGGLLDYATYYPMNNFYQQKGSSQALVDMINTVSAKFSDPTALGTFLDNHDNNRWLNQKNDLSLFKNALAFVILSRGIPIVYYGSEQGYAGGADPANREDLWRTNFNTNSDMYKAMAKLGAARKAHGGLPNNDHNHVYVSDTGYAWTRDGGNLLVITVNSGTGYNGQHCLFTQRPNTTWKNVFGTGSHTSGSDGKMCVNFTNGEPLVLSTKM